MKIGTSPIPSPVDTMSSGERFQDVNDKLSTSSHIAGQTPCLRLFKDFVAELTHMHPCYIQRLLCFLSSSRQKQHAFYLWSTEARNTKYRFTRGEIRSNRQQNISILNSSTVIII